MLVRRERAPRIAHVAGDTADTTSTIVYILGIGFLAYVALEFVLPALFGATAKTRNAYKNLKTPSGSSSASQSTFGPYSRPSMLGDAR